MCCKGGEHGAVDVTLLFELVLLLPGMSYSRGTEHCQVFVLGDKGLFRALLNRRVL